MSVPIVLFVDRGFEVAPIAGALSPALTCREAVAANDAGAVVAIVTGAVPIGVDEVAPYPNLRLVLTCSIGTDHLDLDALRERRIVVANTPGYCTAEVAEHALACVLAGWRGLWRLADLVRAGEWDYAAAGTLRRFDRSRLGIVGLGRIGRALAARARALGIDVVAYDPFADGRGDIARVELEELLVTSDAVSLHLPGGGGQLLGAAEVSAMRPHAILINLARADLVDLDAVVAALHGGRLGGAAWDVWPREPPATDDPRLRTPGLVVFPHAAWFSAEADDAYRAEAVGVLRDVLVDGREPASRVA
jgi:D-3-phosphoglycerate dehydrogenase / 2-oxoglutarate reductase